MSIESSTIRARQRLTALCYGVIAVVLAGIQLTFYLTGYEFETDLYARGPLPTLTAILWIAAAVVAIVLALRLPGKDLYRTLTVPSSPLTDFASLLVIASLAGCLFAPLFLRGSATDALGQLFASASPNDSTARTMLMASMILAPLAVLHFIAEFLHRPGNPAGVSVVLLFTGATALRVYFDMRYLLMSPHRMLHLMALVSVMLFLLAELRLSRGLANRRFYTAFAGIAVILAFADALSNLVLSIMGRLTLGSELNTYFFLITMALFAFSRLYAMSQDAPKKPTAAVDALVDTADDSPIDTPLDSPDTPADSDNIPADASSDTPATEDDQ